MKSIMGASNALERLVKLMPNEAHRLNEPSIDRYLLSGLNQNAILPFFPPQRLRILLYYLYFADLIRERPLLHRLMDPPITSSPTDFSTGSKWQFCD